MCTFELEEQELDEENPWEPFMTAVAHVICSAHHTTLQASPGQIAFGWDMVLPVSMRTDWARTAQYKQDIVNESNTWENCSGIKHVHKVGDEVLFEKPGIVPKMSAPCTGPHTMQQVSTNSTMHIEDGIVTQQENVRGLTAHFKRPN